MSCDTGHCITCSDEGVEMIVVEAGADGIAVCVDASGSESEVMIDLVGEVDAGQPVLVHAGVALTRLASEAKPQTSVTGSPQDFR